MLEWRSETGDGPVSRGGRLVRPKGFPMAKGQQKQGREAKKPKAEKNIKKKHNASQPSQKTGQVGGLEHLKNKR